ncbi:hypothetical protein [Shouchella clausii]|jgi:hypothetical protein|uniref:hypothetical protein n=1 Tax=Shouchella clausii TaxID=79880 RepID=UPI000BA619D1|nr:hypothetical protein [Shouchella clausii]PAD17385.1 hypothetical protein CHH74_01805 [Shouchella clausii]
MKITTDKNGVSHCELSNGQVGIMYRLPRAVVVRFEGREELLPNEQAALAWMHAKERERRKGVGLGGRSSGEANLLFNHHRK